MNCAVRECRQSGAFSLRAEWRIAAGRHAAARIENIVAEGDLLAGDIRLVCTAAIVAADYAAICRRSLRPIDPAVVERQLFGRVVAGWQSADEWRDHPGRRVDRDNAGAVVLPTGMGRLIRVGGEEAPSLEATFERDVDRRPRRLKAPLSRRLTERVSDLFPGLIEHQDIGGERIARIKIAGTKTRLLVAFAGKAVSRLQLVHLEFLRIAEKGDPGREIETGGEHRHLECADRGFDDDV